MLFSQNPKAPLVSIHPANDVYAIYVQSLARFYTTTMFVVHLFTQLFDYCLILCRAVGVSYMSGCTHPKLPSLRLNNLTLISQPVSTRVVFTTTTRVES